MAEMFFLLALGIGNPSSVQNMGPNPGIWLVPRVGRRYSGRQFTVPFVAR